MNNHGAKSELAKLSAGADQLTQNAKANKNNPETNRLAAQANIIAFKTHEAAGNRAKAQKHLKTALRLGFKRADLKKVTKIGSRFCIEN